MLEEEKQVLLILAKARIAVIKKAPYLGSLLRSLIPIMLPGLNTVGITKHLQLCIDPHRILTDPEFQALDNEGLPQKLAGTLAHEMEHICRGMDRLEELGKIDKVLANIAGDLPINRDLLRAGWQLPKWVVLPSTYDFPEDLTMEGYMSLLLQKAEESKATAKQDAETFQIGAGQGLQDDQLPDESNNSEDPQHQNLPKRTQAEINSVLRKTGQEATAYFEGKGRGDMPGWIEDTIKSGLRPKRDWVRLLSNMVRRHSGQVLTGAADYSLSRPSRRSNLFPGGFLRPGLIQQQYEVAVAVDTSGSMSKDDLAFAKSTVFTLLEHTGVDSLWLAQCDSKIQVPFQRVRIREIDSISMKGRGGTSFFPIFEELSKLKPKPDMLIIITDGDGPAPDAAPKGTDVIWLLVPSHWRRMPMWGHTLIASNDYSVIDSFHA